MASKEDIQKALDELWGKYGNTLSLLSDAIDKLDEKNKRIAELEKAVVAGEDIDLDLSTPAAIAQLEQTVLNRQANEAK